MIDLPITTASIKKESVFQCQLEAFRIRSYHFIEGFVGTDYDKHSCDSHYV